MTTLTKKFDGFLKIRPCPAARPIFNRKTKGVGYGPRYRAFIRDFHDLLKKAELEYTPGFYYIEMTFLVRRSKYEKAQTPLGDVDNFAKAAIDGLVRAGLIDDDRNVIAIWASKRFLDVTKGESEGIRLRIFTCDPLSEPRPEEGCADQQDLGGRGL